MAAKDFISIGECCVTCQLPPSRLRTLAAELGIDVVKLNGIAHFTENEVDRLFIAAHRARTNETRSAGNPARKERR